MRESENDVEVGGGEEFGVAFFHRQIIGAKLGIKQKKANVRTRLLSIQ